MLPTALQMKRWDENVMYTTERSMQKLDYLARDRNEENSTHKAIIRKPNTELLPTEPTVLNTGQKSEANK